MTMAATAKTKQKTRARKRATTMKRSSRPRSQTRARKSASAPSSLGKAAHALVGAADAVWSTIVPPLDASAQIATGLLEKQHREVETLFAEALGTEEARTRRNAMNQIIEKLTMHTQIEETLFYPAVRGIDTEEAKDMVLEAYEEHHVVKMILKELPKLDPKADNFEAKMTVLKEMVEHHVDEEEKEMFPMAERKLGAERSRALAEAMQARVARA
jgi:hemerythrin superfamily protein